VKASDVGRLLDYDVILRTIIATLDVVVFMENRQVVEVLYDPAHKKRLLAS
jgi:type IV secretion system protein VirB11